MPFRLAHAVSKVHAVSKGHLLNRSKTIVFRTLRRNHKGLNCCILDGNPLKN